MARRRVSRFLALLSLLSSVRAEDPPPDIERARETVVVKEREFRLAHGTIRCAAWSRDGKRFASAGETGEILVWDAATKKPVARLDPPDRHVYALAFSADGKRLWVAGGDPTVWDIEKQEVLHVFESDHWHACSLGVSPDGATVVLCSVVSPLLIVDEKTFRIVKQIPLPRGIEIAHSIAFRPDGRMLAVSGQRGSVETVDLERGEFLPSKASPDRRARGFAWRADGTLVVCGDNGDVWLGDQKHSLGSRIGTVSVSPDGRRFAAECRGEGTGLFDENAPEGIALFDQDFQELKRWPDAGLMGSVTSWKFDGSGLVCGAAHGLRLWLGQRFESLDAHSSSVQSFDFSADGAWFAAASDGECRFVNTATGDTRAGPENAVLYGCAGGSTFVLAFEESIELWDAAEGKSVRVFSRRRGSAAGVWAISPDGRRLVEGDLRGLHLDPLDGGAQIPLAGLGEMRWGGVEWYPDSGQFVVIDHRANAGPRFKAGSMTTLAVVFDSSGKEVHRREGADGEFCRVSWSADGKSLWWSSVQAVVRLDAKNWSVEATLPLEAWWWQPVDDTLALARVKGVYGLWHSPSGTFLKEIAGTKGLYRERFSREGRRFALAGDKGVVVWKIGR